LDRLIAEAEAGETDNSESVASQIFDQEAVDQRKAQLRNAAVVELLTLWDELSRIFPDRRGRNAELARLSRLPISEVDHLNDVRNQCAHPLSSQFPPHQYDVNAAIAVAHYLRKSVLRVKQQQRGKS
jgi:hypothetical protein